MEEKDSEISGPCEELRIWFCGEVPSGSVAWYCIDVSEKTESSTKKLNSFSVSDHFRSVYHAFLKGCIYSLGGERSDGTLSNDVWILDIKSLDSFAARGEEKPQERLLACGEAQMAAKPYGPDSIPYCKPQEPKKPGLLLALDPDMERLKVMSLQEMAQNKGLKSEKEMLQCRVYHFREHWEEEEDWKPKRLPPLKPPPQGSAWDFLNPIYDNYYSDSSPAVAYTPSRDSKVGEEEGIPALEYEDDYYHLGEGVKHFREHWEEEEDWKPDSGPGETWKPDSGSGETWKPNYIRGPPMTFARCDPHTMVVDQTLYVLGGFEPNQTQADGWIEVFDGKNWESLPSPPDQIHSSVMISGLLKAKKEIIIAKQRWDHDTMIFYRYNIMTRCWNKLVPHDSEVSVHLPPNAGRAVTVGNTLYWITTEEHNHECIIRAYDLDRNMWFEDHLNTATIFGRREHFRSIYSSRPGFLHLRDQKFCLLLQSCITKDYPESSIEYLYCVILDISPIYEHEDRGKFELTTVSVQKYSMDQHINFLDCMLGGPRGELESNTLITEDPLQV